MAMRGRIFCKFPPHTPLLTYFKKGRLQKEVSKLYKRGGKVLMVTATERPDVLRVSFFTESIETAQTEIVCLVEATDRGEMQIHYDHHVSRLRPTGKGDWEPESVVQHHVLSLALEAVIRTHVMYELFSSFCGSTTIRMRESPLGPQDSGA